MARPSIYAEASVKRHLTLVASIVAKAESDARIKGLSLSQWVNRAMLDKLQLDKVKK